VCTVTTNRGVVVGSGTARGKQATVTIRPRANAYSGASSLIASCTKSGQTFSSNRVKVSLGR